MKKKLTLLFMIVVLSALTVGLSVLGSAKAAETEPYSWIKDGEQTGVTITEKTNYIEVAGAADSAVKMVLSKSVDVNAGINFRYLFAAASDFDIKNTARTDGSNYIKTTVTSGDTSIEIISYARYMDAETSMSQTAKMQHDIFYHDPSIKRDTTNNNTKDGTLYLETIETYISSDKQYHTVDLHKENGMWFFATDGLCTIPVPSLNSVSLSNATVKFEVFSKTKAPKFRLYPVLAGEGKEYIQHDFVQFGSDEVTELPDDTVRYRIRDKRAVQFADTELRYREQLISATGYDVREPINIEYSYDVSNASAVWYAVGLGRPNVYNDITKLQYDVFNYSGKGIGTSLSSYSDQIAAKNDGIMFQTTTGLAQPTYAAQNARKESYTTNSASKPYSDRGNLDLLTFIVKENGTDLYHNGKLIFDNLVTKLSDFKDSGYMAYPYFHFFEDRASATKGNTIVIKGINAVRRTDKTALKVVGNSNADIEIGLDDNDNGTVKLYNYVEDVFTEIDSSLYSYDSAAKTLTVKYGFFDGKAYEVYKLYARNNGGSEELKIRFSDPTLVTTPPTVEKTEYMWEEGKGTADLVITIDIKDGIFDSFSGGGIVNSRWEYTPKEGATVGTITIDKDFLNTKKAGDYTFTVRTTNIEEESFSVQFKIKVTEGDGDGKGGDNEVGCGSSAAAPVMGLMLIIPALGMIFFRKRRNRIS